MKRKHDIRDCEAKWDHAEFAPIETSSAAISAGAAAASSTTGNGAAPTRPKSLRVKREVQSTANKNLEE